MHVHPQARKLAAASAERLLPAGRQAPARAVGEGRQGGFQRPHVVGGAQRLGTRLPEQHVLDLLDVAAHALVLLPQHAHLLPLTPHHLHTAVQQSVFAVVSQVWPKKECWDHGPIYPYIGPWLGHRIFKNGSSPRLSKEECCRDIVFSEMVKPRVYPYPHPAPTPSAFPLSP